MVRKAACETSAPMSSDSCLASVQPLPAARSLALLRLGVRLLTWLGCSRSTSLFCWRWQGCGVHGKTLKPGP
eukprot:2718945-Prorocentrum_lima.AAC.1